MTYAEQTLDRSVVYKVWGGFAAFVDRYTYFILSLHFFKADIGRHIEMRHLWLPSLRRDIPA